MSKRTISKVFFIFGIVLQILSLAADVIGIGEGNMFGWKQFIGVEVGLVAIVIGYWLRGGKAEKKEVNSHGKKEIEKK
ncbi:hypothetical protein [Pelolinea submarina]|uniref:Uncharacterized protein n=1 Tax=Pelolinea submarina TaxID=913107 RepID=A0A347ZU90_9CHLR|nr:hypothetical protein [Pelolinea submarina]REG10545.1 hypothetical protein DFR64_0404 [Pelolinea submarina]BBB48871.1 hypothetical protein Pelsub_P2102 [Pelolinea submarina]